MIGDLRKRVDIQAEQPAADGGGGYALTWVTVTTVWADLRPFNGHELVVAGHLEGHVSHHVTMRYVAGVTTDMRLQYNGRVFNIRAVMNVDEQNQWLELLVEEGVAA